MSVFPRVKSYIESHFGVVLLVSCGLGLAVPWMARLPDQSAVLILASLMFVSCFRLGEGGWSSLDWRSLVLFHAVRYGALPWVLWWLVSLVLPQYAVGVFLLTALPAGVSSPAIASIYGGVMAPGFAIVIISQLMVPFVIPAQFAWLGAMDGSVGAPVMPQPFDLFLTMVWCIFVPMAMYVLLKGQKKLADTMQAQGKFLSMLLVALVIALVVAKQRDVMLAQGLGLGVALAVSVFCFVSFMAVGWWSGVKQERSVRTTYAACSCFNNAALGVSLALLHFSPQIVMFVAVSEMAWSLLPLLFGLFLRRV